MGEITRSGNDSVHIGFEASKLYESMQRTPITKEWAENHKMLEDFDVRAHETSNYDWIARLPYLKIHALNDEISVFLLGPGGKTLLEHFTTTQQCDALIELLVPKKADDDEQG